MKKVRILGCMSYKELKFQTNGEGFLEITKEIKDQLPTINPEQKSGVIVIYTPHTSCALCINESYDPSARRDMENFLKHLAPRNLKFITHTAEGEDDSPSHMKSILLQTSLSIIVEKNELVMGAWQGIYLCEFRDELKTRKIYLKFLRD